MIDKAKVVEEFLTPFAETENIEIVDIQYLKENGNLVLRVFIDKEDGVSMDDCAKVSHIFGDALDGCDALKDSYVLEISSPGIDRPLKKQKDFKKYIGEKVRIQTFEPVNKQKNFLGELLSSNDEKIKINDVTNGEVEISFSDIKKANLEADI